MKKILMVALCMVLVPMLFAGPTKDAIAKQTYDLDARDARLAPPPTGPVQINDGRALGDLLMTIDLAAIGVPGGGFSGAGLTWDGTYLYYENQNTHMIYVIDPTVPMVVTSWSAGLPHAWGVGSEANIWIDDALGVPGMTYEYTWGGTPTGNSFNAMSGGASWMGDISEWYTPGEIAILAVGGTNAIYTFTVPGGTPITSISDPVWAYISQRALTYDPFNHTFWLGGWNVGTIWEVDANTGAVLRQFNPADASIAGLAYDWQSTLHPTPVLWLATNATPDYIYMLDADNPQPGGDILYVDDDDNAALSGYFETSFSNLGIAYDIWVVTDSGDVTPDASVMGTYDIVVWTTGDDWSSTFVGNDTIEVANYLAGGGKMWLSSEDILYDLGPVSWLHVASYTNDIGCAAATGVGPIMTGTSFTTTGGVVFDYSDEINPDAFAWTEMQNETPVDNTIAMDPSTGLSYYLFFNTFPFENIDAEADRDTMMSRIFLWLTGVHDVGCASVVSPPEGNMVPAADYDVIGQICNHGDYVETFDVTANVYDTLDSWNVIFTQTVTFTDFPVAGDSNVNFGTVTFLDDKVYYTEIYTELVDANPANDTSTIYTSTFAPYVIWDFETGWQGWTHTSGLTFPAAWSVVTTSYGGGPYWTYIPPPDAGDSAFIIDSDAAGSGTWVADTAMSPAVESPDSGFTFLKWGMYLQFDDMQVLFREWIGSWGSWNVVYAYSGTTGPQWDSVDISAYTGDSIQIAFQYDDGNSWLYGATFDNVMLFENTTGIAEGFPVKDISVFGFAPNMSTVTKQPIINYSTTTQGRECLKVYDNTGRLIRTLVDRPNEAAGTKSVYWNRKDDTGRTVANGVYFIRLESVNQYATHKLILVK